MKLKQVDRKSGLTQKEFTEQYFNKGIPVILEDFVSKDSPAFKKWSYDYFKEIAGDHVIELYGKEDSSNDRAKSAPVARMKFSEYLDLIEKEPTDLRIFLFNLMKLRPELNDDLIYNDLTGGKVLKWLPFLFFGGEGSSTRNHFDIDMSNVFITQYKGTKRIWLFPLEQSDLMYKLPYNFHGIANLKNPDLKQYPALQYLDGYEAEIHPGDTLLMPSGYWHYIQYVTEGFSISVRALPANPMDKWRGFRNLVITRNFDNTMRKIFKDKWYQYKIDRAKQRANRALKKYR
ncbi:cupin-like domain-containing protein [Olivibacter sitiensis]|uniref:cupin-like domain-containing protein n=1 Tax=Olivibacter sitiensis TaxID=376470 RepID=UPI0003F741DF|nr:cupin-like domain-containing protein [Olivibacter sitiensis]